MNKTVKINKVTIKDFKNIKYMELNVEKLTELYGKNSTGKSSVLEAIHFLVQGGKNDVCMIRKGATHAMVSVEIKEGDTDIYAETSIGRDGRITCKGKTNGVSTSNPRTLLKRLFTFGSFDPRVLLNNDKDRVSRLLSLMPIHITMDNLNCPEKNVKSLPLSNPGALDFKKHASEVLKDVNNDLVNSRVSIGRERDIISKAYTKRKEDLDNSKILFNKNYNKDPLSLDVLSLEDSIKNLSSIKGNLISSQKMKEDSEHDLRGINYSHEITRIKITKLEDEAFNIGKQITELQNKQKVKALEIKKLMEKLGGLRTKQIDMSNKIAKHKEDIEKNTEKVNTIENNLNMSNEAVRIKKVDKELLDEFSNVNKKNEQYKHLNYMIREILPTIRKKVLSPIEEKVPGLTIDGNEMKYNGVSVDSLSGSEVLSLSIKLMSLESKSNLLFINEAECMDEETIKKLDLDKFSNVMIARVAKEPLGNDWNSINMEEKTKEVK